MKSLLLSTIAALALALPATAEWKTDFEEASQQAKKENKVMVLNFTGSDWCGWCIKMKDETLNLEAFKEYAKKNLVLVEVDFPHEKKLPAEQVAANKKLKDKYNIRGYPTFLILSPEGKEIGRQVGYLPGGPEAFIAKIEEFRKTPAKGPTT